MRSLAFALLLAFPAAAQFDARFLDRTMRVDISHTGGKGVEIVTVDRIVKDGSWAGSKTRLLDDTNLGVYLLSIVDPDTNRELYTRGFSSLFAEWETTEEAKAHRTFAEALRFPWPKKPVQVVMKKRDREQLFREVFSTRVDPASLDVNPAALPPRGRVWTVFENGPASEKVDLLILGDGYAEKDLPKFHADVKRLTEHLFTHEPFQSRRKDFNVRAIDLPSLQSGVHRPQNGLFRRTPLSLQYNIFGSERYMLTYDERALRDIASAAPYDFVEILANDAQYGGGGIHNSQATAAADTGFAAYVFVHEFGHHFAALADEYYTSDVAYETGLTDRPEPWEPNITATTDRAKLKWRDLVANDTPLPTPWEKQAFEEESKKAQAERKKRLREGAAPAQIDELFRKQLAWDTKHLSSMTHSGKVGAFEGAGYEAKGLYRSSADCIMFTRDEVGFCPVCRRAIDRVIDLYSR